MKNTKSILCILTIAVAVSFSGCKKDLKSEGLSKVTDYPVMSLHGDIYMSIQKGTAFTDPGISSTILGEDVTVTTDGSVDANTPGVYVLTYTSVNKDGYSRSLNRWVGVYDPSILSNDFSGTYARTSNNVVVHWRKFGNYKGIYIVDNIGGVDPASGAGYKSDVVVFNTTGGSLVVPVQPNTGFGGSIYCEGASYNLATNQYSWTIIGAGYLDNLRTFKKQ